jgi:hypothetical protein
VKEVVPKSTEPDNDVTEITEPSSSSSVQKKSRLDDDGTITLTDDGKIWSKPLAEARETTRLRFSSSIYLIFIQFYSERTNSKNIFKHYFFKMSNKIH